MIYKDQLEAVYRLIEKPDAWIKHAYAVDAAGGRCSEHGDSARAFCLHGALARVLGPSHYLTVHYDEKADALGLGKGGSIAVYNDAPQRKHREVLALLKSAIDRAPVRHD